MFKKIPKQTKIGRIPCYFQLPSMKCVRINLRDAKDYAFYNFNVPHDEIFVEFVCDYFRFEIFSYVFSLVFSFFILLVWFFFKFYMLKIHLIWICLFNWHDVETLFYKGMPFRFNNFLFLIPASSLWCYLTVEWIKYDVGRYT